MYTKPVNITLDSGACSIMKQCHTAHTSRSCDHIIALVPSTRSRLASSTATVPVQLTLFTRCDVDNIVFIDHDLMYKNNIVIKNSKVNDIIIIYVVLLPSN